MFFDNDYMLTGEDLRSSLKMPKMHPFEVNPGEVFICIPDLHFPFYHRGFVQWTFKMINKYKDFFEVVHVVQLSDLFDLYGFSRWDKIEKTNAKKETDTARAMGVEFWGNIQGSNIRKYQLIGNHDTRSEKFARKQEDQAKDYIPVASELLTFDDVYTVTSEFDTLQFKTLKDELLAMHGYLQNCMAHVSKFETNVVHGHTHQGDLVFKKNKFGLDCGNGCDYNSFALAYSKQFIKRQDTKILGIIEVTPTGMFQPHPFRYFEGFENHVY